MAEIQREVSSKADALIGLLTNVPKEILDELGYKYQSQDNNLELTILYRGTPEQTKAFIEGLGGKFQDLGFNFAVVNIPREKLEQLSLSNAIQYIELPKSLYEQDQESNRVSCIAQLAPNFDVSGEGVLVGFVDSGIDYTHPAFMNTAGTTRIEYIYDLSTGGNIYNKQMIEEAIKSSNPYSIVPSIDNTGHGTHVAGIACAGGNINPMYRGAAPNASITMVKAARGTAVLSSQIMQGIKFLLDRSKELNMPLVINISLSTNDGAHDGSSLLEQYIRTVQSLERVAIVIAAGNEGDAGHHVGGELTKTQRKIFNIASEEKSIVMNLYKPILPDISINVINPMSQSSGNITIREGYIQGTIGSNRYDIYVSGPKPFELNSEIKIILSARTGFLAEGVWALEINVLNEYLGEYSIWLPVLEGLNPATKFLEPNQYNTLGIPATVDNIIAVGSYNYRTNNLSSFSGRGAQNRGNLVKPDLVAPGEEIVGPVPNGGYDSKTGTSMAAPQVAGICALMMQWGIIKGNDLYLFGQRLKYYLLKGAQRRRTDVTYPNPLWGYGEVCALNSFNLLQADLNAILSRRYVKQKEVIVTNNTFIEYNIMKKNIKRKFMNNRSNGNFRADVGGLKIQCFRGDDYIPIDGARITVSGTTGFENVNNIELVTDVVGLTQIVELPTPPVEYSLDPNINQIPYSLYDLTVERDGFDTVIIRGCQVFPTQIAYQVVNLENNLGRGGMRQEVINIPPNTLNGDYPPKIPEDPEKPLPPPTSGVVLPQPIVPEYIIVHQGVPDDPSAPNYKVPFKDYIKNVASCEIYSTWTNSAIRANIFCIISFTLNRIYTEWYRGKGKNFDITSSTAYDHAFAYGRNFYDNISQIVDEIFSTYVRRIGRKQPLLTQYCDGKRVSCPEWLSQWGSQKLGVQGKVPYEILRYYYGNNIELVTAEKVAGSPQSYPGRPLTIGSSGSAVRTIQSQLNRIARNYPLIPRVAEDGIYGPKTAEAVKTFQQIFGLPQTGVVDYATWYKISDVYVGVTRIAELTTTESSRIVRQNMFIPPIIPGLDNKRGIPKFYY
ncbi:S8 family serine peptidase [Clostridium butyricum]|uniref:S8 family serine peptidase n=1 Tax=Clostridium butyricum TaxID=1492 RepID=UPI0018AB4562|nr:S8 family serine peptidase [Clostridium butyricum]MDB2158132.1 S8 family serine peptidase [Clostridium butyricum]